MSTWSSRLRQPWRTRGSSCTHFRIIPYSPPDHPEACPKIVISLVVELFDAISEDEGWLNLMCFNHTYNFARYLVQYQTFLHTVLYNPNSSHQPALIY
ncbi:hypothetical protein Pyn_18230 [Prunus yedoensis var. nudiflora]|uniref:Uncharacterized protein n=1 Tax=Prunus yedoensis var. nudiflora TaxID=2094558 RepID=A0A314XXS2_PRUYE|nr:hypothetical protein Pyn_18230 [Prunus yedoensis var. nudiflora]